MMSPSPASGRVGAWLLAAIFLALLIGVFAAIYRLAPDPFTALWVMGVLALVLGLAAYLAQALSRDSTLQRALGWGFGAAGFALLFGTIWVGPNDPLTPAWQLYDTLIVLVFLLVTVALARWRFMTVARTEARESRRGDWGRSTPPSAFDYAAANAPGTAPGGAPPSSGAPPPEH